MPAPSDTTGLILAGGRSRRFGRDKALAEIEGVPFIARTAQALAPHVCTMLIATGPAPRHYPVAARVVQDPVEDGGPLAGLAAGLASAETPWVLAVAVDLPFLTPTALEPLVAVMPDGADAIVALDAEGCYQPVCALWKVSAVAPVIREQLAADAFAMHALLDRLTVRGVPLSPSALLNVNAPGDLERLS